ncbi:hypothetical protein BpHYR1_011127 [Brachionus plicatilis]|uniref:Uncharacterized protein n=1 Tax=Brachionus plicatilis TaxID=10195 RepID=A0A3M7P4E9_BRAPC|nr:hypothetical protein BpHYR1_011127 [Brachionus plicatilis]
MDEETLKLIYRISIIESLIRKSISQLFFQIRRFKKKSFNLKDYWKEFVNENKENEQKILKEKFDEKTSFPMDITKRQEIQKT